MKYKKAKKISQIGNFHNTFDAIWSVIPQEIKVGLTSKQLAIVIDLMYKQKEYGFNECYKEINR